MEVQYAESTNLSCSTSKTSISIAVEKPGTTIINPGYAIDDTHPF